MLRTRNLVNREHNTVEYNTSISQIGRTQRARYSQLNNQFQTASNNLTMLQNANYVIYSKLYQLGMECNALEAVVYNYKGKATATCSGQCDNCQTGYKLI